MLKILGNLFKKWGEALSPSKEDIEVKSQQIFVEVCKECPRRKQTTNGVEEVTEKTEEVKSPVDRISETMDPVVGGEITEATVSVAEEVAQETEEETDQEPNVTSYPLIYFERKQEYPTKFSLYEILEDEQTGEITVVFERDNSKPAHKTRSGNYSLANDQGKVITVRRHTILKIVETHKTTAGHEYYRKPN